MARTVQLVVINGTMELVIGEDVTLNFNVVHDHLFGIVENTARTRCFLRAVLRHMDKENHKGKMESVALNVREALEAKQARD